MENAIQIKQVSKAYQKHQVLKEVSLEIRPGEIYGLIGSNGCGKTTLLKILTGMITYDAGQIEVLGTPYSPREILAPSGIGVVMEHSGFIPHLSGKKNLEMLARLTGTVSAEKVENVLRQVGLNPGEKKPVRQYSLGMRQRLSLAQAIMDEPKLLLLDEPTNGLDPRGIVEIRHVIMKLAQEKKIAVLVTSHLLTEIEKMCDRVGILRDGVLLQEISRQTITDQHASRWLKVHVSTVEDRRLLTDCPSLLAVQMSRDDELIVRVQVSQPTPDVIRSLVQAGVSLEAVHPEDQSLETFFLDAAASLEGATS